MLGKKRVQEVLDLCIGRSPAELTEVTILGQDTKLTRYTQNYIHQNVADQQVHVSVRAINQKRIGSAATNQLDEASLLATVKAADALSRLAPLEPAFLDLPHPQPIPESRDGFYASTADCPADLRAAYVERAVSMAKDKGVNVAGALSTGSVEIAVGNSHGVRAHAARTEAAMTCVGMTDNSAGYAEAASGDLAAVDPTDVAYRAIDKCLASRNPISVPPGEYDVILEPLAVKDMLFYLAFMGFAASAYQEGSSFMSRKIGETITGENITIWDDGLDPSGHPMPFDFEGVPKQRVSLIENGVAKGVVYDTLSAGREGKRSTGHALGGMAPMSSIPMNMFMKGGTSTVEELVAGTKRGILVTRFHYVNALHPITTLITGMTRDGTFLVEDGKIVGGLKNLRFTESILGALGRVDGMTEPVLSPGLLTVVCPAIRVRGFTFTGATEH